MQNKNNSLKKIMRAALAAVLCVAVLAGVYGISALAEKRTDPDLNGDGEITDQDAVYLLFHVFYPADYPVTGNADYDLDGEITDQDAIYLLFYVFFPADYPIDYEQKETGSSDDNGDVDTPWDVD